MASSCQPMRVRAGPRPWSQSWRLASRPWPHAHSDRLSGRRHRTDAGCSLPDRGRKYPRLSARSARHDHHSRHSPQPLPRPPLHLSAHRLAHWTLAEQLAGKQAPTQLGQALQQLGIQQIPAYSPQAKGRIERAWRTFQDRLVSELRLASCPATWIRSSLVPPKA